MGTPRAHKSSGYRDLPKPPSTTNQKEYCCEGLPGPAVPAANSHMIDHIIKVPLMCIHVTSHKLKAYVHKCWPTAAAEVHPLK